MPRRSQQDNPEVLRRHLVSLLTDFHDELARSDLRRKVRALIPAYYLLRDLGSSLIPSECASAARDRILCYLLKYPRTVIRGEELMVVAGISEWARRVRELRKERGWSIMTGVTLKEMLNQGDIDLEDIDTPDLKPDDYILTSELQDREAAFRWHVANEIRRSRQSVQNKILEYLRKNVGKPVDGEELRYVARDRTEWARRVRELRTEHGWPVVTRNTGRPELPVGTYLLEENRQSPPHDRHIPDRVRRRVLARDEYRCQICGWSHERWNRSDPRHLELHHIRHHADGGFNVAENLQTVCTICHDEIHRKD